MFNRYNHHDLSEITEQKKILCKKILSYGIADELKDLCFNPKKVDSEGYVKYQEGLYIKSLSNSDLEKEKISIFKLKATKNVEVGLHNHKSQSQTLFVVKGTIVSLEHDITFNEGQSFFVKQRKEHNIKYLKGTTVIVVYLPNLEQL